MSSVAFVRGDHVELAKVLLSSIGDSAVGDLGCIYVYDSKQGIWRAVDAPTQSQIVQGFAGAPSGEKCKPLTVRIGDVSGTLRLALDQVAHPGFFDDAPVGVSFQNGFVRMTDDGLQFGPHAPENRCRFGFSFDLVEPNMDAWLGFLRALFRDDVDRDEKIACLAEFFGASLLGLAPRYQKCIVAIGQGDEGKSTLAKIVTKVFPPGALTAIAPQSMGQEYRRAGLAGKRLNVVNELPESTILESEALRRSWSVI